MSYIFNFKDALSYDEWFKKANNKYAFELETKLLLNMLCPAPNQRLLDIGCGTGNTLKYLLDHDLQLTGIDPSPYMLDIAREKLKNKVDLYRGFAEDLPFDDNSFEYATLMTSLEFTQMPAKAIEEACRVAKDKVFLGVLNKYAPINFIRKIKSLFVSSTFAKARLFSIWELKKIQFAILGNVPIAWRTTPQFPFFRSKIACFIENLFLIQKSPFGIMIGMSITPVPKFKTKPLSLRIKTKPIYKSAPGLAINVDTIIKNSNIIKDK